MVAKPWLDFKDPAQLHNGECLCHDSHEEHTVARLRPRQPSTMSSAGLAPRVGQSLEFVLSHETIMHTLYLYAVVGAVG